MKSVLVTFRKVRKPVLKNVKKHLTWYDPVKRKMQSFEGGQLVFEYKKDKYLEEKGEKNTYRMLPKVVDMEEKQHESISNKDDIISWFKRNYRNSEVDINLRNDDLIFNIPEDDFEDFLYELERQGFNYHL
jgi:hypothetical protein